VLTFGMGSRYRPDYPGDNRSGAYLCRRAERLVSLSSGRPKATWTTSGFVQFSLFPFNPLIAANDKLRDAIAGLDIVLLAPEVQQNHADLSTIARVDGSGAVRQNNGVMQREPASGADLCLVTRRHFDTQPGGHESWDAGFESCILHRVHVKTGVLVGRVRIRRQDRTFGKPLNFDLHGTAIISI
jgi:hypothetical protein